MYCSRNFALVPHFKIRGGCTAPRAVPSCPSRLPIHQAAHARNPNANAARPLALVDYHELPIYHPGIEDPGVISETLSTTPPRRPPPLLRLARAWPENVLRCDIFNSDMRLVSIHCTFQRREKVE